MWEIEALCSFQPKKPAKQKPCFISIKFFWQAIPKQTYVSQTSPIEVQVSSTEDCQYQHGFIITL